MQRTSAFLSLVIAMTASTAVAALENENILVTIPDGYKMDFQRTTKDMLISEMVPVGQSVNNWSEMVTVQIFYRLKVPPAQYKARIDKEGVRLCPGSWSHSIADGDENGYATSVWYQNCSFNKATGKPEFTWFKAMQGNDSLYVVQVALKVRPSEELTARWMSYLRSVRLCDTRLPDRACPADAVAPPH
jgi:hypothetical protein